MGALLPADYTACTPQWLLAELHAHLRAVQEARAAALELLHAAMARMYPEVPDQDLAKSIAQFGTALPNPTHLRALAADWLEVGPAEYAHLEPTALARYYLTQLTDAGEA